MVEFNLDTQTFEKMRPTSILRLQTWVNNLYHYNWLPRAFHGRQCYSLRTMLPIESETLRCWVELLVLIKEDATHCLHPKPSATSFPLRFFFSSIGDSTLWPLGWKCVPNCYSQVGPTTIRINFEEIGSSD